MKNAGVIALLTLMACGGSLSDDQRRKIREDMEDHKIQKISDAEIITASLEQGRHIFAQLEQVNFDSLKKDSLANHFSARISWIRAGSSSAKQVENELIQAYIIGAETGSTQDNIQKLRKSEQSDDYDSLLYSRPVVTPLPDGAVNVKGVWNIYLSKKQIIKGKK